MSDGTNDTISDPLRADWKMLWGNGSFASFQLDIVGFLAVLGEGAVTANYQVAALSQLCYLPRLIPAPQALLPPSRPRELSSVKASVTGVHSGNVRDRLNHVAHILLGKDLDSYTVRCVKVTKKQEMQRTRASTFLKGLPARSKSQKPDVRLPTVTAKADGVLTWIIIIGFFLSVALFILSISLGDGASMIATILLSLLSTLTGIANQWTLHLPKRATRPVPVADAVIRYPNGSFLVVRCTEDVARELLFAPEEIKYTIANPAIYRMISLGGTLVLMLSIIALANAKLQLQLAWAGAYIIINAAYWMAAALPERSHWDLSCYELKEESVTPSPAPGKSFTVALWTAICLAGHTRWARNGSAAPQTTTWDEWLREAEEQAEVCAHRTGKLIEPIWPGEGSTDGTIWEIPQHWDPEAAWSRINDEVAQASATGAMPTAQAA